MYRKYRNLLNLYNFVPLSRVKLEAINKSKKLSDNDKDRIFTKLDAFYYRSPRGCLELLNNIYSKIDKSDFDIDKFLNIKPYNLGREE